MHLRGNILIGVHMQVQAFWSGEDNTPRAPSDKGHVYYTICRNYYLTVLLSGTLDVSDAAGVGGRCSCVTFTRSAVNCFWTGCRWALTACRL
jgi:hypothetical protein